MRAIIFDLDGTLIDSVYAHVLAWQKSFATKGMQVPAWSIHTKIGLSGTQLALAIGRELGKHISEDEAEGLDKRHGTIMKELLPRPEPLPGAAALLRRLREMNVPWGIATSGDRSGVEKALRSLGLSGDVIVVCKSDVEHAKPEPDLFLACRERLKVPARDCFVIGDAVWDMLAARRSGMQGIGVLTGGIGRAELTEAGAYRVYGDPAELDARRHELGFGLTLG
jgi:HAD superfamily hydrolase (TIGR01509 family)